MTIKLNIIQFNILHDLLEESKLLSVLIKSLASKSEREVLLEMDESAADEIRDYCVDALQALGFDETYELTEKGKVFEELIDKFYS